MPAGRLFKIPKRRYRAHAVAKRGYAYTSVSGAIRGQVSRVASAKGTKKDYNQVIRQSIRQLDTYSFVRTRTDIINIQYGIDVGGAGLAKKEFEAYFYTLDEVINPTEFQTLFDYYCIDYVEQIWKCPWGKVSGAIAKTLNQPNPPLIAFHIDRDDDVEPTSENEFLQRQGFSSSLFDKDIKIKFRPKPLKQYFQTDTGQTSTAGTDMKKDQFINIAQYNTRHYGLKVMYDQSSSAHLLGANDYVPITLYTTYYFRCRGVR